MTQQTYSYNIYLLILLGLFVSSSMKAYAFDVAGSGTVTSLNLAEQTIEIDGIRYDTAQQLEVYSQTEEGIQAKNLRNIHMGHFVGYDLENNVIHRIRLFEKGQVDAPLSVLTPKKTEQTE